MELDRLQPDASQLDNFVSLEELLDSAQSNQLIEPVVESASRFGALQDDNQFIAVLRRRLFRLGYLKAEKIGDGLDPLLRKAVCRFQHDAELTVDGWVGPQSWDALQELFAFEPSTVLESWVDGGAINPAMQRAVSLRLIALGFGDKGVTRAKPSANHSWLGNWRKILILLEVPNIDPYTPLNSERLIEWLFNIDRLSLQAQKAIRSLVPLLSHPQSDIEKQLFRFITSLLKVELWLLGYDDIKPDGKAMDLRFRQLGGAATAKQSLRPSKHYRVIKDFLQGRGAWQTRLDNGELLARCFRSLVDLQIMEHSSFTPRFLPATRPVGGLISAVNITESTSLREQNSQLLIGAIEHQLSRDPEGVEQEWQHGSLGSRLWDGVKRVWRYLQNVASKMINGIKMLVRAGRQLATQGFELLRQSYRAFSEGLKTLLQKQVAGSNDYIAMQRDKDFDFTVFVSAEANKVQLADFFVAFERRMLRARAALNLIRLMLNITLTLLATMAGPWGWWRLVRALMTFDSMYDEGDRQLLSDVFAV